VEGFEFTSLEITSTGDFILIGLLFLRVKHKSFKRKNKKRWKMDCI